MHLLISVISLASALLLSQAPELMQQYIQRLGGAADELARIVQHFDEDSARSGYDRSGALGLMVRNPERLIRDQATRMQDNISRLGRLRKQQEDFKNGAGVASFLMSYDPELFAATRKDFKMAMPMTADGLLFALLGFAISYLVMLAATAPLRSLKTA
jgi:hypothetical protein